MSSVSAAARRHRRCANGGLLRASGRHADQEPQRRQLSPERSRWRAGAETLARRAEAAAGRRRRPVAAGADRMGRFGRRSAEGEQALARSRSAEPAQRRSEETAACGCSSAAVNRAAALKKIAE